MEGCWYLLEVEQDASLPPVAGHGPHGLEVTTTGVYYAKGSPGPRSCSAADPVEHGFHHWFGSYSSVDASG